MTFIRIIIIYRTTLNRIIVAICTRQCIIYTQSFFVHELQFTYIHGVVLFILFPISPCSPCHPSLTPFVSFSTYLHPPAVTGTVLPPLRLLVNWPYLPPPFTQLSHPLQLPITPTTQRQTMTTLGPLRSGYAEHSPPPINGSRFGFLLANFQPDNLY